MACSQSTTRDLPFSLKRGLDALLGTMTIMCSQRHWKKINGTIGRSKTLDGCFSYVPDSNSSNGLEGGAVICKSGGEVRSLNRVYLIHGPSDLAERVKGCTCRVYFHTGLPCTHIAWLVNHLGKDTNNCMPQKITVVAAAALMAQENR